MTHAKYVIDQYGNYRFPDPISSSEIIEVASAILKSGLIRGECLNSPKIAGEYARTQLGALEHEVFASLFLDNRHQLIAFEKLFTGTINSASVHPREVVKRTLEHNAAAVIFAHNHPSGIAEPSSADESLTRHLKAALALIDVRLLDHVVVSALETTSMSERGLI